MPKDAVGQKPPTCDFAEVRERPRIRPGPGLSITLRRPFRAPASGGDQERRFYRWITYPMKRLVTNIVPYAVIAAVLKHHGIVGDLSRETPDLQGGRGQ